MITFLIAPVLAGLLGLAANSAADSAAYLPRLRFLFLGAAIMGYAGLAVFVWLKVKGWRRWVSLVAGLLVVRLCYLPILHLGVIVTGWLEWIGRQAGAGTFAAPVHYSLGLFVAFFSAMFALLAATAATHLNRWKWVSVFVFFLAFGVVAMWDKRDRAVSPHPFEAAAKAPALYGPDHTDVVNDKERPGHKRALALLAGLRHLLSPSDGWGGEVRSEMLIRFRGQPDAHMGARVTMLEAALIRARGSLRTSPRTPRASAARPQPARSCTRR